MDSKNDHVILNGLNYIVWVPDMETLLKIKGLWKYIKVVIPNLKDDQIKFDIDRKKYEVVWFITTYISREILFHISGIDCPHEVWKNLKYLFDKFDESQVIQLDKELISLDPHSFERIEDYLVHVKGLKLKLGECGKNF
jgi:hypothetical protein